MKNKIMNIELIFTLISILLVSPLYSFGNEFQEIKEIKSLYTRINRIIKEGKVQIILLYADSDGYDIKKWNKLQNLDEKCLIKKQSIYKAWVYLYQNNIVKTIIHIDSISKDWNNTTEYYYYDNGKVAFIFRHHFTFLANLTDEKGMDIEGPFIVEERVYFNRKGERIRFLKKAFIKHNKKEVPEEEVQQINPEFYLNVDSLPFINLIKSSK